jgi:hypothetical protein
VLFLTLQL